MLLLGRGLARKPLGGLTRCRCPRSSPSCSSRALSATVCRHLILNSLMAYPSFELESFYAPSRLYRKPTYGYTLSTGVGNSGYWCQVAILGRVLNRRPALFRPRTSAVPGCWVKNLVDGCGSSRWRMGVSSTSTVCPLASVLVVAGALTDMGYKPYLRLDGHGCRRRLRMGRR